MIYLKNQLNFLKCRNSTASGNDTIKNGTENKEAPKLTLVTKNSTAKCFGYRYESNGGSRIHLTKEKLFGIISTLFFLLFTL